MLGEGEDSAARGGVGGFPSGDFDNVAAQHFYLGTELDSLDESEVLIVKIITLRLKPFGEEIGIKQVVVESPFVIGVGKT